jgi:hypothetical protein
MFYGNSCVMGYSLVLEENHEYSGLSNFTFLYHLLSKGLASLFLSHAASKTRVPAPVAALRVVELL